MAEDPTAEFDPERILRFKGGIPGFPGCERFALVELADDSAFQILQSVDVPEVSMIVGIPWMFFPDYEIDLSAEDQRELGIERMEDAVVFCPVTLDAQNNQFYVNLMGPFVVNAKTRQGRQIVLSDRDLPLRAAVQLA